MKVSYKSSLLLITGALILMSAFSFSLTKDEGNQYSQLNSDNVLFDELFLEHGTVMMILDSETGRIVSANKAAEHFYGYSMNEMEAMTIMDMNTLSSEAIQNEMKHAVQEDRNYFLFKHRTKNGELRDVEVYSYPYEKNGNTYLYSVIHDVTDKRIAENRLKATLLFLFGSFFLMGIMLFGYIYIIIKNRNQLRKKSNELENLFNNIEEGFIAVDNEGFVITVNPVAMKILKCSKEDLFEHQISKCYKRVDPLTKEEVPFHLTDLHKNRQVLIKNSDGRVIPVEESVVAILDAYEKKTGLVVAFKDISEKLEKQREIEYLSYHDQLTGLYNRRFFEEELKRLNSKRNYPLSVIMFDVNGLKLVNDAFGHESGDLLLKTISSQLKDTLRSDDIVARIGGDEFVALMPRTEEGELIKLIQRFKSQVGLHSVNRVPVSVSVGYSQMTQEEPSFATAFRVAEDHMYEDKLKQSAGFKQQVLNSIEKGLLESDPSQVIHRDMVVFWSEFIGRQLEESTVRLEQLRTAARFHDIGKIAIAPSSVLISPLEKVDEEIQFMKHPEIGYHILKSVDEYMEISEWVLSHHEAWDGSGYPRGLKQNEINFYARILSVSEAIGTALSENGGTIIGALESVKRLSGTKYDPDIVCALERAIEGASEKALEEKVLRMRSFVVE